MKEFAPIRDILDHHWDLYSEEGISSIEKECWSLIELFKENESSFLKIAQYMIIMLNRVLTSKNKAMLETRLGLSKFEKSNIDNCIENLYELAKIPVCWMIISKIQTSFSAYCIQEAVAWISPANERTLFLKRSKENSTWVTSKIKEAEEFKKLAEQKYQEINNFCSKYSVLRLEINVPNRRVPFQ